MVHGFHLFTDFFNLLQASFHRPFFSDLDVIRCHQPGNGIGIIAQKFQSNSSLLRIKVIDGILDEFIREILKKSGSVIRRHGIQNFGNLFADYIPDGFFLKVGIQMRKHIGFVLFRNFQKC